MKIYSVIFKDGGKEYYFKAEEEYLVEDYVIVKTDRGMQYGKIVKALTNITDNDYKLILRKANDVDEKQHYDNLMDATKAHKKARQLVKELDLNMNIISADYTFDRSQLLFNFLADERIDFRELAKRLAGIYRTRIELRQIGARDKAREMGGVGPCGQEICCVRFLNYIEPVGISMAKNQNIALNPNKINGTCGRLLCCLAYEDEQYVNCNKGLPYFNQTVKTKYGTGNVINVNILERKYTVMINGEKKEICLDNEND